MSNRNWPRYKIVNQGSGVAVVDTWTERQVIAIYGDSKRNRQKDIKKQKGKAEYHAMRRVARLRRIIMRVQGVKTVDADRIARELDTERVGAFDHWFYV